MQNMKKKNDKTETATVIYKKQKKEEQRRFNEQATTTAKDILNEIIDSSFNKIVIGELIPKTERKIR